MVDRRLRSPAHDSKRINAVVVGAEHKLLVYKQNVKKTLSPLGRRATTLLLLLLLLLRRRRRRVSDEFSQLEACAEVISKPVAHCSLTTRALSRSTFVAEFRRRICDVRQYCSARLVSGAQRFYVDGSLEERMQT